MFRFTRMIVAGLALGLGLVLAGCASDSPPKSTVEATPQGVMCSKCQVTWVQSPELSQKGRIIGYKTVKKDTCPDCMDAVTSFFNTGKLQHTCKTCGDTLEICEAHVH